MTAERRNKAENPVEKGRPSINAHGGLWPTLDKRVRQLLVAKEPLCGSQPANLSLVIAVLCFPSCFVVLPFQPRIKQGGLLERNIF
jgi:hypothetical protein